MIHQILPTAIARTFIMGRGIKPYKLYIDAMNYE